MAEISTTIGHKVTICTQLKYVQDSYWDVIKFIPATLAEVFVLLKNQTRSKLSFAFV
jgi:hypothetical protein